MLTPAQAIIFRDKMTERFNARVYDKERAVAMFAAAGVLAVAGNNPKEFLESFSTTIPDPEDVVASPLRPRSAIYLSKPARDNPDNLVITMSHECHHAFRQQKDWPASTWFYAVSDQARGEEEVQAYVIGESVSRRLTGRIRTVVSVQETLDKSYHLGAGAKKAAKALLTGAWMSLEENLVPPMEVAIFAHGLLDSLGVPSL